MWIASGVPNGGCNLNPSPLNQTNPTGSWKTPYLLGSKSYTLTCRTNDGQVLYASTSVVVNGIDAGVAPAPNMASQTGNQAKSFVTATGQTVMNGAILDEVSGLVTLDPTLFTDASRAKTVTEIKFLEDSALIQTVKASPFALDTTKLTNGKHAVTQQTSYQDGSISEITRVLSINNLAQANSQSMVPFIALAMLAVLGGGGGGSFWLWYRNRRGSGTGLAYGPAGHEPKTKSGYGDSIDSTLIGKT